MPKIGEIVIMPDGNKVRYLEMNVAENAEERIIMDINKEVNDDELQRESEEVECIEQPEQ